MAFELERIASDFLSLFEKKETAILPLLKLVQEREGYVSEQSLSRVADLLGLERAEVEALATFYDMIARKPVGKYPLRICVNVSCSLRGARRIVSFLQSKLGIVDKVISEDGLFSIIPSQCLGACEMAPMLQIRDAYFACLDQTKLEKIIEGLRAGVAPEEMDRD